MYLFLWMEVRARDLHFVKLLETPECSPVRSMCDIDTLLRVIIDDAGLRLPAMDALNIPLGVDVRAKPSVSPKYQDRICVARAASATRAPQFIYLPLPPPSAYSSILRLLITFTSRRRAFDGKVV
jgi:hypothetical protein